MATTIHIEQALIGQVKQRDQSAFMELYDRTISDISRLVAYLLDDPSQLEDVIQEIYVALYHSLPKFDAEKPFHPWLMGIVMRQVKAHQRKNWRFFRMKTTLAENVREMHAPDIAEQVVEDMQSETLIHSIRSLPVKLRSVVVLYYLHEYTRDEIADILGIPPGTVASRLRLALEKLRFAHAAKLQDCEGDGHGL